MVEAGLSTSVLKDLWKLVMEYLDLLPLNKRYNEYHWMNMFLSFINSLKIQEEYISETEKQCIENVKGGEPFLCCMFHLWSLMPLDVR